MKFLFIAILSLTLLLSMTPSSASASAGVCASVFKKAKPAAQESPFDARYGRPLSEMKRAFAKPVVREEPGRVPFMQRRFEYQELNADGTHAEPIGSFVNFAVRTQTRFGIHAYRSNAGYPVPNSLEGAWPMMHRAETTMTGINKDRFYKTVYGKYDIKFSHDLIEKLSVVDNAIEMDRTTYAEIRSRHELLGTWRFFTARAHWTDLANDVPAVLPYVRMNRIRGAPELRVTEKLNKFMDDGIGVVEIGKFSVVAETPELQARVTHLIEMDWLALAKDDSIYVAHVTTPAHARLYKKYGFEVAEEFLVPGNEKPEAILWVRGHALKTAIQNYLKVSSHGGWVPDVAPLLPAEFRALGQEPAK